MHQEHKEHLVDRICSALGVSQAELARELKITRSAINDWKKKGTNIPSKHCKYLEGRLIANSSPINCIDMRPSDWIKYWPELAQVEQKKSEERVA